MFWYYLRMGLADSRQLEFFRRLDDPRWIGDLFDYVPDVYFYVKDSDSRFVAANQAVYCMCGLEDESGIVGRSDYDFFPRHLSDQYVREDQQVMQSRSPLANQVWLVPNRGGELKWFLSTKVPLFGDGGVAIGRRGTTSAERYRSRSRQTGFSSERFADGGGFRERISGDRKWLSKTSC